LPRGNYFDIFGFLGSGKRALAAPPVALDMHVTVNFEEPMTSIFNHPSYEPHWHLPTPRERKPTLASVWKQAQRAGVPVASMQANSDGSITIVPGQPANIVRNVEDAPTLVNDWSVL
jgi:hypothetical protein